MIVSFFLPVMVVAVLLVSNGNAFDCPKFCECRLPSIIQCKGDGVPKQDLEDLFKDLPIDVIFFKLTNTSLTTLETSLFSRSFMRLTQLDLEKNQLTEVPKNLSGVFPSLESLKLQKNKIASLRSADFVGLKNLKFVYIQGNKLTNVGSSLFASNEKLERIFLSFNEIETLSEDAFDGLKVLKDLRLDGNKIKNLKKGVFRGLSKASITLAKNSIRKIEAGLFVPNQIFGFLDFDENMITEIDTMAFANISINVLVITKNKLESLPITVFESSKSVSLTDNPLKCDCHMAKIVEYLQSENRLNRIVGGCHSPDSGKGLQLKNVKVDTVKAEFGCTICDFNNTCLNGGNCMAVNDTELECKCQPDFEGDNCETKVLPPSPIPKADDSGEKYDSTTYIIIVVVVLVIVAVLVMVACYCLKGRKTQTVKKPEDGGGDTLLKPQGTDGSKDTTETVVNM